MTEEQIELLHEKRVDALDAALIKGSMSKEEYDTRLKEVDRWAERAKTRADRPAS